MDHTSKELVFSSHQNMNSSIGSGSQQQATQRNTSPQKSIQSSKSTSPKKSPTNSPKKSPQKQDFQEASAAVELEYNAVKRLKRLSIGNSLNFDPDLPLPNDEDYYLNLDYSNDSSSSSLNGFTNSRNGSLKRSKSKLSKHSITRSIDSDESVEDVYDDAVDDTIETFKDTSRLNTSAQRGIIEYIDSSVDDNSQSQDLDASIDQESILNNEEMIWVPATAHPQISPENFKKHIENTDNNDNLNVKKPSLRELTTQLATLSKRAGLDDNDAITLARSLSTRSIGITKVERDMFTYNENDDNHGSKDEKNDLSEDSRKPDVSSDLRRIKSRKVLLRNKLNTKTRESLFIKSEDDINMDSNDDIVNISPNSVTLPDFVGDLQDNTWTNYRRQKHSVDNDIHSTSSPSYMKPLDSSQTNPESSSHHNHVYKDIRKIHNAQRPLGRPQINPLKLKTPTSRLPDLPLSTQASPTNVSPSSSSSSASPSSSNRSPTNVGAQSAPIPHQHNQSHRVPKQAANNSVPEVVVLGPKHQNNPQTQHYQKSNARPSQYSLQKQRVLQQQVHKQQPLHNGGVIRETNHQHRHHQKQNYQHQIHDASTMQNFRQTNQNIANQHVSSKGQHRQQSQILAAQNRQKQQLNILTDQNRQKQQQLNPRQKYPQSVPHNVLHAANENIPTQNRVICEKNNGNVTSRSPRGRDQYDKLPPSPKSYSHKSPLSVKTSPGSGSTNSTERIQNSSPDSQNLHIKIGNVIQDTRNLDISDKKFNEEKKIVNPAEKLINFVEHVAGGAELDERYSDNKLAGELRNSKEHGREDVKDKEKEKEKEKVKESKKSKNAFTSFFKIKREKPHSPSVSSDADEPKQLFKTKRSKSISSEGGSSPKADFISFFGGRKDKSKSKEVEVKEPSEKHIIKTSSIPDMPNKNDSANSKISTTFCGNHDSNKSRDPVTDKKESTKPEKLSLNPKSKSLATDMSCKIPDYVSASTSEAISGKTATVSSKSVPSVSTNKESLDVSLSSREASKSSVQNPNIESTDSFDNEIEDTVDQKILSEEHKQVEVSEKPINESQTGSSTILQNPGDAESTEIIKKSLRETLKLRGRPTKPNQPLEMKDSAFGFPLPPVSNASLVMLDHRFPVHVERAIYRLSHLKLADPKRPLRQQVLLSNFMYSYLNLVNHTLWIQSKEQDESEDNEVPISDRSVVVASD